MSGGIPAGVAAQEGLAELERRIDAVDAVSFDLFDTLFVRPLVDPEDVFDILGETHGIAGFRALRRAAQAEAFRRMLAEGRSEIDLDGIYQCFGALPAPAERLCRAEYELELEITLPNPEMVAVFRRALALGKRVAITSDMYLPLSFFETLLDRHGLERVPLFISSARGATKRDHGALFDILAAKLGLRPDRILHVGDNPISDITRAEERGLQAWHYREARVPARRGGLSPTASLARGLVRIHQAAVPPGSAHELGFLRGGPAALGVLDWIAAEARRDGVEHILFVSRDGHVLQALAERHRAADDAPPLPASSYLLGSRVAFTLAGMDATNFAAHLPFLVSGAEDLSPVELLERIGVPAPAEHVMQDLGLGRSQVFRDSAAAPVLGFLQAWRGEILKACRRNRRGLLRHLLDLGLRPGQRVAFVDIGWNGTTQEAFEGAVRALMPLDVRGYYFCLTDSSDCRHRRQVMRMKAMVDPGSVPDALLRAVYANRVSGEIFFSAPHDPVIGYEDGPGGVLAVEDAGRAGTGDIAATVRGIEAGMLDFAECFRPVQARLGLAPDPLGMAMPLLEFMADGGWADHPLLARVENFDAWASSRNRGMRLGDYADKGYVGGAKGSDPSVAASACSLTASDDILAQCTAPEMFVSRQATRQNSQMVELCEKKPAAQSIVDIFAGEWSSQMPAGSGLVSTGPSSLFEDGRMTWLEQVLGPVKGMNILELGPLEGAHTYMLHGLGARAITAIEANPRAFLRCLAVKEIFGLDRAKFHLGSFIPYLEELSKPHDLVVASGVLYHMTEPLRVLDLLCKAAESLFIWSHYYDYEVIRSRADSHLFSPKTSVRFGAYECGGSVRTYPREALAWPGFSGGGAPYSIWLTRAGLLGFLKQRGFNDISLGFDHPDHPNGPALALCAKR